MSRRPTTGLDPAVCRQRVLDAIRAGVCTAGAIEKTTRLKMRETDRALEGLRRSGEATFDTTTRQWRIV